MVALQNVPALCAHVKLIVGRLVPGDARQPVDVRPHDADFGSHRSHHRQPRQFFHRLFVDFRRQPACVDLLADFVDLLLENVFLAQFVLDDPHLLAQVNLALRAIHLLMHLAGDLVFQFEHAQFLTEQFGDVIEPLFDVERFQQPLAFFARQRQRRGDQVSQPAGIIGVERVKQHFFRDIVVQFNRALEQVQHRLHGGVGLARVRVDLCQRARFGDQIGARLREADDLDAPAPLTERAEAVVRHPQNATERDLDADRVEFVRARIDRVRVELRHADHASAARPAWLRRR